MASRLVHEHRASGAASAEAERHHSAIERHGTAVERPISGPKTARPTGEHPLAGAGHRPTVDAAAGSAGLRSLVRLQASAGNAAVSSLLRRRRPLPRRIATAARPVVRPARAPLTSDRSTPSTSGALGLTGGGPAAATPEADLRGRPFDLLQREALAEFAPPPPPTPIAPAQDPRFLGVTKGIHGKAAQAKRHPPAKAEAKKAQDAAAPPAGDKEAQAKAAQSGKMAGAQPGAFDKAAFVAAVKKAIEAASPKTLDDADKFASSGKADGVKSEVMSKVSKGKEASARDISDATKAPPDPSVATDKPVVPLTPDQATAPGDPKAARAMPGAAPAEQTQLDGPRRETDAAMADAGVTEEQLAKSNEPQFQDAVKARKEGEEHSATAAAPVRAKKAQTLAGARAGAAAQGTAVAADMGAKKTATVSKVGSDKDATRAKDEAERAKVAADINAMYDATKTDVEKILTDLDARVTTKFDAGEAEAKRAFTADHTERMRAWKEKRYAGVDGAVQWGIDLFKDLPPEANQIFIQAKTTYEKRMEAVIGEVADLIGGELDRAKARITEGRAKISRYVSGLPRNLRKVGAEAAAAVQDKFDQLASDVDAKSEALVSDLADKYVAARQAVDEEITKLQEENKGLWSKAKEAVGGVIETIKKLKDMLLGVLARAAGAVEKIIKDPIGFLGNLVNAVKAGVMGFASRIGEHLKKGLMGWLFGELAAAGIELPEKFDLKGILKLVMSLLGLTYANIRARAVAIVGEKVVARLEQVAEVFKILVTEGPAGLWKFVVDKIGDIKEQVLGQIKEFVITKIITAGVMWLISLLNPASAFVKACKAIYDIVMFIVDKAAQIKEFVDSVLDSVEAIAAGGAGKVAGLIENTLAKMLPVVIGFLASLLGLGGISEKIKSVLAAIQKPVNKAIDWVIKGALKLGKKLIGKGKALFAKGKAWVKGKIAKGKAWVKGKAKAGKEWLKKKLGIGKKKGKGKDERTPQQKAADRDKALAQAFALLQSDTPLKQVTSKLPAMKAQYQLTELRVVEEATGENEQAKYHIEAAASPGKKSPSQPKGIKSKYVKKGTVELKAAYHEVREWFYKKGFRSARKGTVINEAAVAGQPGWYWCAGHGSRKAHKIPFSEITLDHRNPVAGHWNNHGFKSDQATRYDWYDRPGNLIVLCGSCNSSKGSSGRNYRKTVGEGFKGWKE